jgi:type IV pilus assembly protein PilC
MALGLTAAMLLFIVPVFATMFETLGGTLPLPTQILMILSDALRQKWWAFVLTPILLWQGYKRVQSVPSVRLQIDRLKLKVPVFGSLFHKVALSRFTRNLGGLLKAGVPILQALEITSDSLNNMVMAGALEDVKSSVREGESIAAPLTSHPVFPSMVVQMVAVGEETGAIDVMLEKIADFYDTEVAAATEALTAMLEPLMMGLLGGIVGGMVIALYLPMFKIFDLIN